MDLPYSPLSNLAYVALKTGKSAKIPYMLCGDETRSLLEQRVDKGS